MDGHGRPGTAGLGLFGGRGSALPAQGREFSLWPAKTSHALWHDKERDGDCPASVASRGRGGASWPLEAESGFLQPPLSVQANVCWCSSADSGS